jgi:hypothetical protein
MGSMKNKVEAFEDIPGFKEE